MKKITFIILLLCCFQSIALASTGVTSSVRIVGGEKAPTEAYPWAVALFNADISDPFCGASLIRADVVLTAAHCVADITNVTKLDVVVGVADLGEIKPVQRIPVQSIVVHPDYDNSGDAPRNDIALLRLSRAVSAPLVPLVTTVLMNEIIAAKEEMMVLGWGALDGTDFPDFPQALQHVSLPYVDSAVCNAVLGDSVTENMFCAGIAEGGKDSCQGDSGGPMVYFDANNVAYQVGIVSWGEGCAEVDKYGVYTRVLNYLDWIETTMAGLHVADAIDAVYIGQGQSSKVSILIDYWGDKQDLSITSVVTQYGDFIGSAEHNCAQLSARSHCFVDLTLTSTLSTFLSGRVLISFSDGQSKAVDISANILSSVEANVNLGTTNWTWFSGGDAPWHAARDDERTVYKSAVIADNQSAVIMTYVDGPGTLAFDWKVSSELDYDFVDLYVDEQHLVSMSGEQVWQRHSVAIAAGRQAVSWRYTKDNSDLGGEDHAAVDNVSWTPSLANTRSGGGGGSLSFILLLSSVCVWRRYWIKVGV